MRMCSLQHTHTLNPHHPLLLPRPASTTPPTQQTTHPSRPAAAASNSSSSSRAASASPKSLCRRTRHRHCRRRRRCCIVRGAAACLVCFQCLRVCCSLKVMGMWVRMLGGEQAEVGGLMRMPFGMERSVSCVTAAVGCVLHLFSNCCGRAVTLVCGHLVAAAIGVEIVLWASATLLGRLSSRLARGVQFRGTSRSHPH
ncbi:hypothetical protein BKA80DRAFT_278835 [Phyllosticta citrichinensis]